MFSVLFLLREPAVPADRTLEVCVESKIQFYAVKPNPILSGSYGVFCVECYCPMDSHMIQGASNISDYSSSSKPKFSFSLEYFCGVFFFVCMCSDMNAQVMCAYGAHSAASVVPFFFLVL